MSIYWSRPCYKCKSHTCDLSCKGPPMTQVTIPTWQERMPEFYGDGAYFSLKHDAMQAEIGDLRAALQAAPAQPDQVLVDALEANSIDWHDMYQKEKRRSEMWIKKYEKDIGPLAKVTAQAQPSVEDPRENPYFQQLALEAKSSL